MRRAAVGLVLVIALGACSVPEARLPDGSIAWQADAFLETLPGTQPAAYVEHARAAMFQSHGPTYVEDWTDQEFIDLAALWCDASSDQRTTVMREDLAERGFEVNIGRNFVPPPPVDRILSRVAEIHERDLCPLV
jgi:hypothetical protein